MSKPLRSAIEWAGALLLCLVAVEAGLRVQQWCGPLYDLEPKDVHLEWFSDVVNHRPARHQVTRFEGEEMYGRHAGFSYTVEYDDNGIRQPVSRASRPDCRQTASILFMGDSFMQGYDLEHTVPDRVAAVLAEKHGICSTAYNAGYMSYSPAILVPLARQLVPAVKPHYVVVDIDETDMADDVLRYDALIVRNSRGENVGVRASPVNYDVSMRLARSEAYPLYLQRLAEKLYIRLVLMPRIAATQPDVFKFSRDKDGGVETKYGRELSIFRRNIAELIDVLSANLPSTTRIIFIRHPHRQHLTPDGNGTVWNNLVASTIEKVAAERGALYFDAAPVLAPQFGDRPEAFYWKNDMHFTLEGLTLYADSVADFLSRHIPEG